MPAWEGSTRRHRLPADWPKRKKKVMRRDKRRCQLRGPRCEIIATEVDHIRHGDDHSLTNLQAVCYECHKVKSSTEGALALKAKRQEIASRFQRDEDHPGLISDAV